MIVKNSLIVLAILASAVACDSDKKSRRSAPGVAPETTTVVPDQGSLEKKDEDKKEEVKPEEKKEEVQPEEKKEETTPVVKPTLDLIGQWTSCEAADGVSHQYQLTFNDKNEIEASQRLYKGDDCQTVFTAEEIENTAQSILAEGQSKKGQPTAEAVAAAEEFKADAQGETLKGTFVVGEAQEAADRALEYTFENGGKISAAYKIENDKLTITRDVDGESEVTVLTRK